MKKGGEWGIIGLELPVVSVFLGSGKASLNFENRISREGKEGEYGGQGAITRAAGCHLAADLRSTPSSEEGPATLPAKPGHPHRFGSGRGYRDLGHRGKDGAGATGDDFALGFAERGPDRAVDFPVDISDNRADHNADDTSASGTVWIGDPGGA